MGITINGLTAEIGFNCIPIVGNTLCTQQAACCTGEDYVSCLIYSDLMSGSG